MSDIDIQYHINLNRILKYGYEYEDPNRPGVMRKEIEDINIHHKVEDGAPILSLRKIYYKGAINELLFFLSGSTDIRDLWDKGVNFWNKDWENFVDLPKEDIYTLYRNYRDSVYKKEVNEYDMGKIYSYQYRLSDNIDQIQNLINGMVTNPMSTSLIVTAWNPSELPEMCLKPCHFNFQITCYPLKELPDKYGFTLHWSQRSCDYFLGIPTNIIFYYSLGLLLGAITGHKFCAIRGDLRNVHLYSNQINPAEKILTREYNKYENAKMYVSNSLKEVCKETININEILKECTSDDFIVENYKHYDKLSVPMLSYG